MFLARLCLAFFLLLSSACSEDIKQNRNYDNMIFALSWSPTYCLNNAQKRDVLQCESSKKYRMIIHGLWPQLPSSSNVKNKLNYCESDKKEVSAQIIQKMLPKIPSSGLINHSWRKHGSCSSMGMEDYFSFQNNLYNNYKVGDYFKDIKSTYKLSYNEVKSHVVETSNSLRTENIIIRCKGRMLKEVRICLDKDGNPRKCNKSELKNSCKLKNIYIPFYD